MHNVIIQKLILILNRAADVFSLMVGDKNHAIMLIKKVAANILRGRVDHIVDQTHDVFARVLLAQRKPLICLVAFGPQKPGLDAILPKAAEPRIVF